MAELGSAEKRFVYAKGQNMPKLSKVRTERPDGDGRWASTVRASALKFWPKNLLGCLQVATECERTSPGGSAEAAS